MLTKLLTVAETAEAPAHQARYRPSWMLRRKTNSYRVGTAVRIGADEIDRVLNDGLRPAIGSQRKGVKA